MHASRLFIVFTLLLRVRACLFYATHNKDPTLPPDFALPGFAALVELTMAAQQMDHDEAITFLEQCWEQTGLGGVCPNQGDDRNHEEDEDAQQR